MPIVRSYACAECNHFMEVTLATDQWDTEPPECPACAARAMGQVFTPPRINGSPYARANAIAEKIAEEDYGVSNMHRDHRAQSIPKVAYRDDMMGTPKRQGRDWTNSPASTWGASGEAMAQAQANGRRIRKQFGDGLDVLQSTLKDGTQPDLIALSKRKSMRVY